MQEMDEAKKVYEKIEIPAELRRCVEEAVREGRKEKRVHIRAAENERIWKKWGISFAAGCALFIIIVNTDTAVAEALRSVPVVGRVASVFTISSYKNTEEDKTVSVEVPGVESEQPEKEFTDQINRQISSLCEKYEQEARASAENYKEAFLRTGGTQEEWEQHKIQIDIWYEVKGMGDDYLSLMIGGNENWLNIGMQTKYYNWDMKEQRELTLKDLFGEEYKEKVNSEIFRQMEQRKSAGEVLWGNGMSGFESVDEQTRFYIDDEKNVHIVFEKYEIAPGSSGRIEFKIPGEN